MRETAGAPMRPKTLSLLLATGAVLALPGCLHSDEDAAAEVVKTYLKAFAEGDGEKACSKLSEQTRRVTVPKVARGVGAKDCEGAIRALRARLSAAQVDALERTETTRVKLRGKTAEVAFRAGSLRGIAKARKSDDGWKISLLPRTP